MHPGTMLTDAIREWPTPTASMATPGDLVQAGFAGDDPRRPSYAEAQSEALALWPTPRAVDARSPGGGTRDRQGAGGVRSITGDVKLPEMWMAPTDEHGALFPTPTATPFGTSQNEGQVAHERRTRGTPSLEHRARHGSLPSLPDPSTPAGAPTLPSTPILNPRFVGALMNFPIGWTEIG